MSSSCNKLLHGLEVHCEGFKIKGLSANEEGIILVFSWTSNGTYDGDVYAPGVV